MANDSVLEIVAYGAWNGGTVVDNSIYEPMQLQFKGGIPVNNKTIEERMGVRTRKTAGTDERIGVTALQDLLENNDIDHSRVKLVIGATNVGDDKYDPGPLIQYPYETIREHCPAAQVFDLYAGCPGFNVSVELAFMLSLNGFLQPGDISIIVGAENIHRANAFPPDDTANIIFGDDVLAAALRTNQGTRTRGRYSDHRQSTFKVKKDLAFDIMSFDADPQKIENIGTAYVESGKYNRIVSVYLAPDSSGKITVHERGNCSVVCMQRLI